MLIFLTATRPRKMALMPVPTAFNTIQLAASVLEATDSPSVMPLRAIIAEPTPAAATFVAANPATAVRIAVRFSLAQESVLRRRLPTAVSNPPAKPSRLDESWSQVSEIAATPCFQRPFKYAHITLAAPVMSPAANDAAIDLKAACESTAI